MHSFLSVFHSQADGIGHLCGCDIDSHSLAGDSGGDCCTVNSSANRVVSAVQCELYADIITQDEIPSLQGAFRFADSEYGCRQH